MCNKESISGLATKRQKGITSGVRTDVLVAKLSSITSSVSPSSSLLDVSELLRYSNSARLVCDFSTDLLLTSLLALSVRKGVVRDFFNRLDGLTVSGVLVLDCETSKTSLTSYFRFLGFSPVVLDKLSFVNLSMISSLCKESSVSMSLKMSGDCADVRRNSLIRALNRKNSLTMLTRPAEVSSGLFPLFNPFFSLVRCRLVSQNEL